MTTATTTTTTTTMDIVKVEFCEFVQIHDKFDPDITCFQCRQHGMTCPNLEERIKTNGVIICETHGFTCPSNGFKENVVTSKSDEKKKEKRFICPICFDVCKSYNNKRNHMYTFHNHEKKKYSCKKCDKVFYQKYFLDKHEKFDHVKYDKTVKINLKREMLISNSCSSENEENHEPQEKENVSQEMVMLQPKISKTKNSTQEKTCQKPQNQECEIIDEIMHEHQESQQTENITSEVVMLQPKIFKSKNLPNESSSSSSSMSSSASSSLLHVKCNICEHLCKNQIGLDKHMRAKHENPIVYTCPLCPQSSEIYSTQKSIQEHMKKYHENFILKECICQICEEVFHNKINLKRHIRQVHENIRKFQCDICLLSFKSKWDMNRHRQSKHNTKSKNFVKDFQCTAGDVVRCASSFSRKDDLIRHRKKFHPSNPEIKCQQCPAMVKKFSMKHHILWTHEPEKLKFQCEKCEQKFLLDDHLIRHVRQVHADEKKFVCNICKNTTNSENIFWNKVDYNLHLHKYHNEKSYSQHCLVCKIGFYTLKQLGDHYAECHYLNE